MALCGASRNPAQDRASPDVPDWPVSYRRLTTILTLTVKITTNGSRRLACCNMRSLRLSAGRASPGRFFFSDSPNPSTSL